MSWYDRRRNLRRESAEEIHWKQMFYPGARDPLTRWRLQKLEVLIGIIDCELADGHVYESEMVPI